MKKIRYVLFIVTMLLCVNVYAANDKCTTEELNRLKELASKVEYSYDYKIDNDGAVDFSITATNLNQDIRVVIIEDYYRDKFTEFVDRDKTHTGTLNGFHSGDRVQITIQGYVPNGCAGKKLLTKTVKIPYYNYYYDDEKCKGNEDYKYCKLLLDDNITEKKFNDGLAEYVKNRAKTTTEEVVEKKEPWKYVGIIGVIVFAVVVIVVVAKQIEKRRKKNSL